jgi:DNA-binding CsgD family transcriptional regulator
MCSNGYPCKVCRTGRQPCNHSQDTIMLLGDDGTVLWVNGPMPGLPLTTIIGTHYADYSIDPVECRQRLEHVAYTGQPVEIVSRDCHTKRVWYIHMYPVLSSGTGKVATVVRSRPGCELIFQLSCGQIDVLSQLIDGKTVESIASERSVSTNTIRTHLLRARRQLDFPSLADMISWAVHVRLAIKCVMEGKVSPKAYP